MKIKQIKYSETSLLEVELSTSGTKNFGPNNEVALLMRLKSTSKLCLGPNSGGHYISCGGFMEPLSDVSL